MPGSQIVGVTRKCKAHENMSAWSGKRFLPFYFVFALSQFSRPRLSRSGEVCSLACQVRVSCITCITSVAAVVSFPQRPLCVGVAGRLPRDEAWGHYHGDLDELSGFLVMTSDPVVWSRSRVSTQDNSWYEVISLKKRRFDGKRATRSDEKDVLSTWVCLLDIVRRKALDCLDVRHLQIW